MRDERGSTTLVFGLLVLLPVMVFSMFLIESRLLYMEKSMVDDAVVAAGLAALKCVNSIDAAYGEYVIEPSQARTVFDEYLKKNLKLDDNFNPLPGSIAATSVIVEDFRVYNPDDVPTECPEGTFVRNSSIHVVVSLKVERPALRGLFGSKTDIVVHRDVDNFYSLNFPALEPH